MPSFGVAVLIQLADGVAVTFQARFGHVQRLGIAKHPRAVAGVYHAPERLAFRVGVEGGQSLLLELVRRVGGLTRGVVGEADGVVGLRGKQHGDRLRRHHAHEVLRTEGAVLGTVDDVLIHIDEIPCCAHLGGKYLGLLASLVLGLGVLQRQVPQDVDGHERNHNDADGNGDLETYAIAERAPRVIGRHGVPSSSIFILCPMELHAGDFGGEGNSFLIFAPKS